MARVKTLLAALPKSLRVGPHHYAIELTDMPAGKRVWGEFDSDAHVISIDTKMPTSGRIVETLLHEILHAIWDNQGLPTTKTAEETAVAGIAVGLCSLLIDNPELVAWLRRAIK